MIYYCLYKEDYLTDGGSDIDYCSCKFAFSAEYHHMMMMTNDPLKEVNFLSTFADLRMTVRGGSGVGRISRVTPYTLHTVSE